MLFEQLPLDTLKIIFSFVVRKDKDWLHIRLVSKQFLKVSKLVHSPIVNNCKPIKQLCSNYNIKILNKLLIKNYIKESVNDYCDELSNLIENLYYSHCKKNLDDIKKLIEILLTFSFKEEDYKIYFYILRICCLLDFSDLLEYYLLSDIGFDVYDFHICVSEYDCHCVTLLEISCNNGSIQCIKVLVKDKSLKLEVEKYLIYRYTQVDNLQIVELLYEKFHNSERLDTRLIENALIHSSKSVISFLFEKEEYKKYKNSFMINWCLETNNQQIIKQIIYCGDLLSFINQTIKNIITILYNIDIKIVYSILYDSLTLKYIEKQYIDEIYSFIKNKSFKYDFFKNITISKKKYRIYIGGCTLYDPIYRLFKSDILIKEEDIKNGIYLITSNFGLYPSICFKQIYRVNRQSENTYNLNYFMENKHLLLFHRIVPVITKKQKINSYIILDEDSFLNEEKYLNNTKNIHFPHKPNLIIIQSSRFDEIKISLEQKLDSKDLPNFDSITKELKKYTNFIVFMKEKNQDKKVIWDTFVLNI